MTPRARARKILQETAAAPRMFCSCREALLARCSVTLEMAEIWDEKFYERWLGRDLQSCTAALDDQWAALVIQDALSKLEVP